MDPESVRESLKGFVATLETLLEIVPGASPQELLDYAQGVIASPVAASVLCAAVTSLNSAKEEKPPVEPVRRKVFGAR